MKLYRLIMEKYIVNDPKCGKLLSRDGVTTQDLAIEKVNGIMEGLWINSLAKKALPGLVRACGILKNLDDYQYIICSEIRSIPDSSPYKKVLQKYRITIVAAFAKFVGIAHARVEVDMQEWIHFAHLLLEITSDTVAKARLENEYLGLSNDSSKSIFDYFDIPENEIDYFLERIY